jgi:tRNA-uridine 2-sulfurtransferase
VLDYESKFRSAVIDDFIDTYLQGETPTPCIRCNQSVKFKDLMQVAKDLKADCLATGHYVSKVNGQFGFEMHKAKDHLKDQSYFLFATTNDQLAYLEFPLGHLDKSQTRAHAVRLGLEIADKPDSQDICFVNGSYSALIEKMRPNSLKPGIIMHVDGYQLGEHKGIVGYTIGQRRGIGIAFRDPLYVVKIDPINNVLYVGPQSCLYNSRFSLKNANFLGMRADFVDPIEVQVKIRSTCTPVAATLHKGDAPQEVVIDLFSPEKSVTPGQACVFYDGSRLLGGGWIAK